MNYPTRNVAFTHLIYSYETESCTVSNVNLSKSVLQITMVQNNSCTYSSDISRLPPFNIQEHLGEEFNACFHMGSKMGERAWGVYYILESK